MTVRCPAGTVVNATIRSFQATIENPDASVETAVKVKPDMDRKLIHGVSHERTRGVCDRRSQSCASEATAPPSSRVSVRLDRTPGA